MWLNVIHVFHALDIHWYKSNKWTSIQFTYIIIIITINWAG